MRADQAQMPRWYLTFGQKYRTQDHPTGMPIHPDFVVEVLAPTYDAARNVVHQWFGTEWAFLNEWDDHEVWRWYSGVLCTVASGDRERMSVVADREVLMWWDVPMPPRAQRPLMKWFKRDTSSWRYPTYDGTAASVAALGQFELRQINGVGPSVIKEIVTAFAKAGYEVPTRAVRSQAENVERLRRNVFGQEA